MKKVAHQKVEKVLHQEQKQQNQQNQRNQQNQENQKQREPAADVNDCQGMIAATHLVGILQAGGLPEGELLQQKTV